MDLSLKKPTELGISQVRDRASNLTAVKKRRLHATKKLQIFGQSSPINYFKNYPNISQYENDL